MVLQFFTESEGDTLAVNEGWKPKATPVLDSHDIPYNPADCIRLGNERSESSRVILENGGLVIRKIPH